jgi:hypothetical protein
MALLSAVLLPASALRPQSTAPATELASLLARWRKTPPPLAERIAALRDFVQRNEARKTDAAVLRARLRLGSLYLDAFDADSALIHFASVRELSPQDDHDLRGRALYGLAQAQELRGDRASARQSLERVIEELRGTRYAECARIAQNRLDRSALQTGQPLPALQGGNDLAGKAVVPARGNPLLIVVIAGDHRPSVDQLVALQSAWLDAGLPANHLITYAVDADADSLRELARTRDLRGPIVTCEDGFLHPDLLALGVTGVPTSLLVAADHSLLLRDPPPDRLRALLSKR